MSAQGRVMILTSKTGGGHISLAESLRDHIQQNCQVQIIDPLSRLVHSHYRTVSRYAMWIWSEEYKRTNTPARALQSQKLLSRLASARLRQEIKAAQPDLIISTHPLLSYSVMRVIERMGKHIPFILLFTDPENLHAAWFIERDITLTMAPTTETARQALSLGFPADRVKVVGWPVREQFTLARKMDGKALLQEKGLDPHLFTVFLQGGGEGAARFAQTVQSVLDASEHVQLILACGTNRLLRERFLGHPRILALPFTKSIASYMAAADVVMGKAGPNMLFESVTLG
ncbi:MAG TPA: glycosyltransferase, partial [Ktedonobacterales bacterium]